jgi:membrane protein DedA with SNARE-associated domain
LSGENVTAELLIGVALAALLVGAALGMLAGYLLAQWRGAPERAQ